MKTQNDLRVELRARIENDLGYHKPPNVESAELCGELRKLALGYARAIIERCPIGRDLHMALSHIEEASRAAVASVAKTWPLEGADE